jgi:hypothetical protein
MLLLSALAAWVPIQGYTGLYTVIIVDTVFMAIWLWLMTRVGDALRFTSTTSAALAVTVIPLAFNTDFGTEAKLLLPLAWSLVLAVRRVASDETRALRAGLLGAAVCFTRLDAVLFVSCVSAAVVLDTWMNRGRTPSMHIGLRLFGPAAVVLSLYALYNLAVYGHPSTISSWLKFGSRALERSQGASLLHMELHLQAAVAVAVVLALVTVFVAFRRRTFNALLLGALGVWLIAYFGIMITFLRGGMEYWNLDCSGLVSSPLSWAALPSRRWRSDTGSPWAGTSTMA